MAGANTMPATTIAETNSVSAERMRAAKTRASSADPSLRYSAYAGMKTPGSAPSATSCRSMFGMR